VSKTPEGASQKIEQALGDIESTLTDWESQVREANAKIEQRAGRPLWQAIAVGLLLGGLFVGALLFEAAIFAAFIAILVGLAVTELVGALREKGSRLSRTWMVVLATAIVAASYFLGAAGMLWGLLSAIVTVALVRLIDAALHPEARQTILRDIQGGVFVVVYLPFLASFAVITTELALGQLWIFVAVVIVVVVDTAAYATGLAAGKHKLAPKISPAKTWEGFAGAALAAAISGGLLGHYLLDLGWGSGIILGLVLLGSATMGDLVESLIKRDLGIKDMSSLLPGHGGFLDRLDSALPSMAVAYIAYQLLV